MTIRHSPFTTRHSPFAILPSSAVKGRNSLLLVILALVLSACTIGMPSFDRPGTPPAQPTPAAVLPEPTISSDSPTPFTSGGRPSSLPAAAVGSRQVVEIRVVHVHDLSEVLVQASDQVEVGQILARLSGYAEELGWDVQLIELQLAEARATLDEARLAIEAQEEARRARLELEQTQAETAQQRAIEAAQAAKEKASAQAQAEVARLQRKIEDLARERAMASTRLAMAQAEVDYRQRWLEVLEPLEEFDPWGDLPYLVGSQSGPQGQRSDLAYREALARAQYDLQIAELELGLAQRDIVQLDADLSWARSDLAEAQANLEATKSIRVKSTRPLDAPPSAAPESAALLPPLSRTTQVQEASVRVNEHRQARARAELEETVVKSLVTGKVLDVRIDRVDGDEATVIIRIMAELPDRGG